MSSADVNIDEALARDLANLEKLRKDVIEAQERLAFPPEPVAAESSTVEVAQLERELKESRSEFADLADSKRRLEQQLTEIRQGVVENEARYKQTAADLAAERQKTSQIQRVADQRELTIIDRDNEIAFLTKQQADALKKVDDLGSELEKIRADLKKAIENKGGVDDNSSQLIKENNKLNEQLKALQFKAKRYYDEVTRFREQSGPQPKKRS